MGDSSAAIVCLRSRRVKIAPINVAIEPNIISIMMLQVNKFDSRQPIANPGIAAGVNIGSMHSASESLS